MTLCLHMITHKDMHSISGPCDCEGLRFEEECYQDWDDPANFIKMSMAGDIIAVLGHDNRLRIWSTRHPSRRNHPYRHYIDNVLTITACSNPPCIFVGKKNRVEVFTLSPDRDSIFHTGTINFPNLSRIRIYHSSPTESIALFHSKTEIAAYTPRGADSSWQCVLSFLNKNIQDASIIKGQDELQIIVIPTSSYRNCIAWEIYSYKDQVSYANDQLAKGKEYQRMPGSWFPESGDRDVKPALFGRWYERLPYEVLDISPSGMLLICSNQSDIAVINAYGDSETIRRGGRVTHGWGEPAGGQGCELAGGQGCFLRRCKNNHMLFLFASAVSAELVIARPRDHDKKLNPPKFDRLDDWSDRDSYIQPRFPDLQADSEGFILLRDDDKKDCQSVVIFFRYTKYAGGTSLEDSKILYGDFRTLWNWKESLDIDGRRIESFSDTTDDDDESSDLDTTE